MTSHIAAWSLAAAFLPLALQAQAPNGPAPVQAPAPAPVTGFPPANPKFFTATTPTVDTVNAFLKSLWGYDSNRIWSVAAILATNAPGVAKIVVFIGDKTQPGKTQQTVFFTTPDGKHAIADNVIEFGPTPFAESSRLLQTRANGPARGPASKGLLLVEFTDLQCPHCKDAQPIMDQLAADFPQARIVVEDFPLVEIHPYAFEAATQGFCVRRAKGDEAFFRYAQTVFEAQGALTPESYQQTLSNAVVKAGGDAAAVAACAKTQPAIDSVNASSQLAKDLGVDSTPMLFVNGQPLPISGIPYETLKKIIVYRANQEGVPAVLQPSLKSLK